MRSKVQKWGNSLAVRIPKAFAEETGLVPEALVNISVDGGALVVLPLRPRRYELSELLRDVRSENLHGEVELGPAVGAEVW